MNFLKRAWKGQAKLWMVFWGGVLIPQIVGVLTGVTVGLFFTAAGGDPSQLEATVTGIVQSLGWNLFWTFYYILLEVVVWRCSFNTRWKPFGYIARVAVLICIVLVSLTLVRIIAVSNAPQPVQVMPGAENVLNPDNTLMRDFQTIPAPVEGQPEAPADGSTDSNAVQSGEPQPDATQSVPNI